MFLELILWLLLIFALPANLFLKLCTSCGYVHGVLSDYLIPKLYLSDLLIVALIVMALLRWLSEASTPQKTLRRYFQTWWHVWLSWLLIGILQLFSVIPLLSIWLWVKITLLGLLGIFIAHRFRNYSSQAKKTHFLQLALSTSMLFQSGVALYQWVFQRSLAGYWLWGEPNLAASFGLARTQLPWGEMILPYGTTAHPNVLAGFLCLGLLGITQLYLSYPQSNIKKLFFSVCVTMSLAVIGYTQSASAQLTLSIGGTILGLGYSHNKRILKLKKYVEQWLKKLSITSLLLIFMAVWLLLANITYFLGKHDSANLSLYRRAYLIAASREVVQNHPLAGTGLGTFTAVSEQALPRQEVVRFNQPVHHGLLLVVSELGLVGTLLLLVILRKVILAQKKQTPLAWFALLMVLTPLIVWDHYLISLETGQLLILASFIWVWALE